MPKLRRRKHARLFDRDERPWLDKAEPSVEFKYDGPVMRDGDTVEITATLTADLTAQQFLEMGAVEVVTKEFVKPATIALHGHPTKNVLPGDTVCYNRPYREAAVAADNRTLFNHPTKPHTAQCVDGPRAGEWFPVAQHFDIPLATAPRMRWVTEHEKPLDAVMTFPVGRYELRDKYYFYIGERN